MPEITSCGNNASNTVARRCFTLMRTSQACRPSLRSTNQRARSYRCFHSSEAARCDGVRSMAGSPRGAARRGPDSRFCWQPTGFAGCCVRRAAAHIFAWQESEACLECYERTSSGAVFEHASCRAGLCYRCSVNGAKEIQHPSFSPVATATEASSAANGTQLPMVDVSILFQWQLLFISHRWLASHSSNRNF